MIDTVRPPECLTRSTSAAFKSWEPARGRLSRPILVTRFIPLTLILALALAAGVGQAWAASDSSFVAGKVFEDTDGNGTRGGADIVRSDVTVTLSSGTKQLPATQTDKNGGYEFTDLAAGTYRVTAESPSGFVATQLELTLDGKNGTRLADISLTRAPTSAAAPVSAPAVQAAPPPPPQPTPTPSLAQQLGTLAPIQSASFLMEGRSEDNGRTADFVAHGNALQPGSLDMRLTRNGEELDLVVVGQSSYRRGANEEYWLPTDLSILRGWHGVLSVLDVLSLPSLLSQARAVRIGGLEELGGGMVRRYEIELGPPPAKSERTAGPSSRLEVMEGLVELWVHPVPGPAQSTIHKAHLQLIVPSARRDQPGRVGPATLDTWLRFSEHDSAFSINPPLVIAPPTAESAPVAAPQAGTAAPQPARPVAQPAPAPASAPAAGSSPRPQAAAPPELAVPQPAPEMPPVIETSPERSAAAERALQALESASGPRQGSRAEPGTVVLAVPWRGVLVDPARTAPTTDGLASLAMVLEAFGVTVGTADLQSLAETWQEAPDPSETVRLSTLTRIGERGSLRPLGPARGVGGGNWTAALARDYLGRGYPVIALVRSSFLPGGSTEGAQSDRYVTLVGFEGDELLYHDPATPDGLERRVKPAELDKGWASATPPRQGIAFGFGASVIGLLNGSAEVKAEATSVPAEIALPPADPKPQPQVSVQEAGQGLPGGIHPALVGFLTLLAGGLGFVVSRLAR